MISCRPWSSRLHPYPLLVRMMKTYLELKDQVVNSPCSNPTYPDRPDIPSTQKSQDHRRVTTKELKKRSRNHQTGRRQYTVRLIKRPLLMSNMAMPLRPEAALTTVTATLPSMTNPIITSTTRPTTISTTVTSSGFKFTQCGIPRNCQPPITQIIPKAPWKSKHPYGSFREKSMRKLDLLKLKNPPIKQMAASCPISSGKPATANSIVTANITPAKMCKR